MDKEQAQYIIKNNILYTSEVCEINVVDHCNYSCRSCRHLSPICKNSCVTSDQIYDSFSKLSKHYRSRTIKVLGGEPLLHPNLTDILWALRHSKVSECLIVSTNGTKIRNMNQIFWDVIDGIVLSIYPSSLFEEKKLLYLFDKCKDNNVSLIVFKYNEFREAYTYQSCLNQQLLNKVYNTCKTAHVYRGHTVHDGFIYRCPHSVYLRDEIDELRNLNGDRLKIEDKLGFAQSLLNFFENKKPLNACKYCLGSVGKIHKHEQVERKRWREYQNKKFNDCIDNEYLKLLENSSTIEDECQVYLKDWEWREMEDMATKRFMENFKRD